MAKRPPATRPSETRIIHYVDPSTAAEPARGLGSAQLAARKRLDQQLYGRWAERQHAIAERDRRVRRFWLTIGAVIVIAVLAALVLAGRLLWTGLGLGALIVPALVAMGPRTRSAVTSPPSYSPGTDTRAHTPRSCPYAQAGRHQNRP